jgi:phosphoenolpyruvate phosphomutase
VVAGYKAQAVDASGIRLVENPDFATSGELRSLRCALDRLAEDTVVLYGDLLFRRYILRDLLDASDAEIAVVVDSAPLPEAGGNLNDLAYCDRRDDRGLYRPGTRLLHVSRERHWSDRSPDGRWIGILRIRGEGSAAVRATLAALERRADFDALGMPDLLNALVDARVPVQVLYIHGH